jgi:hypothetical protein
MSKDKKKSEKDQSGTGEHMKGYDSKMHKESKKLNKKHKEGKK